MSSETEYLILYITHQSLRPELPALLDELNQPNREFTAPYGLSDIIHPSSAPLQDQIGGRLENLIELHRTWATNNGVNPTTNENASLFLVADEGSLSTASSRSVQIVHFSPNNPSEFQTLRSPIDQAVGVYTTIDGGQQGWEEFVRSAQNHGGILPPIDDEDEADDSAPGQPTIAPVKTMLLPVKPRPTE